MTNEAIQGTTGPAAPPASPQQVAMSTWQKVAYASAAVSSMIAFIAFAFTLWRSHVAEMAAEVSEWQTVVVLEILRSAEPRDADFSMIRDRYLIEAVRFPGAEDPHL